MTTYLFQLTRMLMVFFLALGIMDIPVANAQLPQSNLIYMNFGPVVIAGSVTPPSDTMMNYNPALPVSATNPSFNSIVMPHGNVGLAVSKVLGSSNNTLTYYTIVNLQYWFYDPVTNAWVNTNHSSGPAATVNIGAGGGFIYSLRGLGNAPSVYRYDGTGPATFLTTVPASPRPYDLAVDCEGNFYIISNGGPIWNMTKHNPSGAIVQAYTVSNPNGFLLSGGLAIMGNDVYADDGLTGRITHATISGSTVTFNSQTAPVPYTLANHSIGDFASFPFDAAGLLPTLSIAASDTIICNGGAVTFSSNATGGGGNPQFQWLVNGVNIAGATNQTLTYTPSDNDVITCQMTGNGGCSAVTVISQPITIHVQPAPAASFILPATACLNDTIVAVTDSILNIAYQWDFGGAGVINGSGPGPYELVWNTPGIHTVTLQAGQGNCAAASSKSISVFNAPALELNVENNTVCMGDKVKLNANTDNATQLQWLPGNGYTISDITSNSADIVPVQSATVYVKAVNDAGCSITKGIDIHIADNCCALLMPNAFSPNGDGLNDVFEPVGKHFGTVSLKIFDRWGQLIFSRSNDNEGWNGNYKGTAQEMGTYFYEISYHCAGSGEVIEKKGDVTLVR